jgi:hypothetical protein
VLATGISRSPGGTTPRPPSTSTGEFTMDAEAKAAFDNLNKRLGGLGGGQSVGITNQADFEKRFDALEKRLDEAEARANKRWTELFKSGAPRKT